MLEGCRLDIERRLGKQQQENMAIAVETLVRHNDLSESDAVDAVESVPAFALKSVPEILRHVRAGL